MRFSRPIQKEVSAKRKARRSQGEAQELRQFVSSAYASNGLITYSVLSLKPGSNQASERSPKERRGDKTGWTKPRSSTAVWTMGIVKARSSAERGAWLAIPR